MPRTARPALERFMERITVDAQGCWLWGGALDHGGYGKFTDGRQRRIAHRFAYEQLVGAVPDGLDLDHLCRVRRCVNPSHLEPVTRKANVRRGAVAGFRGDGVDTECVHGHPMTGSNIAYRGDGRPCCRECRNAACRAWRQRRREAT